MELVTDQGNVKISGFPIPCFDDSGSAFEGVFTLPRGSVNVQDFIEMAGNWCTRWLSGCTLLSHKFWSVDSNPKKVSGFFTSRTPHLPENLDYGSYDRKERRKWLN